MDRLMKCIRFQIKHMLKSMTAFTCIYAAAYLAITVLILSTRSGNSSGSVNAGFYLGAAIFIIIYVMANYKETFNYLLMFGSTRNSILLSMATTIISMSALFAALSTLAIKLEGVLSSALNMVKSDGGNILLYMYPGSGTASMFLWLTMFYSLIGSFSLLYGALAYKLGKVFVTVFWVAFGASWVVLPVTSRFFTITSMLKAYFHIGEPGGILLAPVSFLITFLLFGGAAYLTARRQPQTA